MEWSDWSICNCGVQSRKSICLSVNISRPSSGECSVLLTFPNWYVSKAHVFRRKWARFSISKFQLTHLIGLHIVFKLTLSVVVVDRLHKAGDCNISARQYCVTGVHWKCRSRGNAYKIHLCRSELLKTSTDWCAAGHPGVLQTFARLGGLLLSPKAFSGWNTARARST